MAKILLAEDDSAMREFIAKTLRNAGHDVESCENGARAFDEINSDNVYDLLLTDIVMPGMDGIELSQKASDKHPNMKVMFITGFAAVAMDQKGMQKQDTKILSKPFHLKELVDEVNKLLAG
jgi:two-component system cell cycle response regulator CpdR